jgi:hypothetical protein
VNVMMFPIAISQPSEDILEGTARAVRGTLVAASEAIAESRRVRAEAADELAAWAAILHQAA